MEETFPEPSSLNGFTIRVTEGFLTQLSKRSTGQPRFTGDQSIHARTPRERYLMEQVAESERRKRLELAKRLQLRLQQLEERRLAQARESSEQRLKELEKRDYNAPMPVGPLPCEPEREALLQCYSKNANPLQCANIVFELERCAKQVELQVLRRQLGDVSSAARTSETGSAPA
ncbi:hypothetical protein CCYA_CCYA09G2651 [Cyanidiococcus yangmingshanensis]|nr:hypothetical protein CCYA_CCYA09G2651 [Cyanidiococcus yangmingshanensis]